MSNTITVVLPEKINSRINKAKKETGLTKSEIARRGMLRELDELEVEN